MLKKLRRDVLEANLLLPRHGLVTLTWGNVSAIDRDKGLVVIKPSGVSYESMTEHDMVIVTLDGAIVEGELNPSSDTPTHLALYRAFESVQSVVHTHSRLATAFAQAERDIPCYGTTHADSFYGPVPVTRALTREEIADDYELNTGHVIVECFHQRSLDPTAVPGALVRKHGPFAWGKDARHAVENAVVIEEVAHMAWITELLSPGVAPAPNELLEKHYARKHGAGAYYGQKPRS